MAKQPSIPRSKTNPVGQTRRIARTERIIKRSIARARGATLQAVASWPYVLRNEKDGSKLRGNEYRVNAFYDFNVSVEQVAAIVQAIENVLMQGGGPDEIRAAAQAAYNEGTARTVDNLRGLSDDYVRTIFQRLQDQDVIRRAALAGSRAFEQMQGFSEQTAQDLGRILFEAIQDGENPRQTARKIRDRFRVSRARAERIARTEITMAHRRGRWDEARDAEERFGLRVMLLHNSALIPERTRRSHAERHGRLFTRQEEAEWYSINGNAINCLCSQTEVVVGENGEPTFGKKLIERMEERRAMFLGSGSERRSA